MGTADQLTKEPSHPITGLRRCRTKLGDNPRGRHFASHQPDGAHGLASHQMVAMQETREADCVHVAFAAPKPVYAPDPVLEALERRPGPLARLLRAEARGQARDSDRHDRRRYIDGDLTAREYREDIGCWCIPEPHAGEVG